MTDAQWRYDSAELPDMWLVRNQYSQHGSSLSLKREKTPRLKCSSFRRKQPYHEAADTVSIQLNSSLTVSLLYELQMEGLLPV